MKEGGFVETGEWPKDHGEGDAREQRQRSVIRRKGGYLCCTGSESVGFSSFEEEMCTRFMRWTFENGTGGNVNE